ncbi:hypothetical protein HYC85_010427 [Camellia sinensis]|uniref:RING-CH-type domain-containing protein n=1 Tax=Camellia sinensis TaxID=4442 RepID=A0A7J7HI12_CAMSI|nr:hypothetical protein HYC85_010427 [Camellia sinensis]
MEEQKKAGKFKKKKLPTKCRPNSLVGKKCPITAGVPQVKVHLARYERDCRICHLSLDATNQESNGIPIELGCSCKDDLAAAHRHCAEAWFKIKSNNTNPRPPFKTTTTKNVSLRGDVALFPHREVGGELTKAESKHEEGD